MALQAVEILSDMGASRRGAAKGVEKLCKLLAKRRPELIANAIEVVNDLPESPDAHAHAKNVSQLHEFFASKLMPRILKVLQKGDFPLIFSGDHSSALGNLQALKKFYANESMGIVWVDAHSDLHTPYDSPSGNMHGMPLGGVLDLVSKGENVLDADTQNQWRKLCDLGGSAVIKPQNLIYVGVRSMEKSEKDLIAGHGIPLFSVDAIRQDFEGVTQKILDSLKDVSRVYLSIDVDVLDAKVFKSTGVRENHGLLPDELRRCADALVTSLGRAGKLAAVEFTEFNPTLEWSDVKDDLVLVALAEEIVSKLEESV